MSVSDAAIRADEAGGPTAPCPLTGKPSRRIHGVSARFLEGFWQRAQGVDVKRLFKGIDRVTLYESPTGLVFFEPRIIGDGDFYETYYRRWDVHSGLNLSSDKRIDYMRSAKHIPEGASVLDVGCGPAMFRHHLPHARYTGLDPYAEDELGGIVVRETLEEHARKHAGSYDAACAFHVIEHVPDPLLHARQMVELLKPGGLLILAAPLHPSLLTEIPNLPLNIPPHHVTWWNPGAFTALAEELGLTVVEASALPPSPHQGVICWLSRLLIARTAPPPDERYVANRWSWHLSLWLGYALARIATRIRTIPGDGRPVDAYLVARKA